MEEAPDTELMLRYKKNRDNEAFAKLVRRYQKPIINFFYRLCWEASLAEDLAQETMIRLAQAARHYRATARLNTFLYAIARNIWIDYVRTQKYRLTAVSLDKKVKESGSKETTLKEILAGEREHPTEGLINKEMINRIKTVLKDLPEDQRLIINLCMLEGMNYEEVAEVLRLPVGTVKSRLHFTMLKLKDLMKK